MDDLRISEVENDVTDVYFTVRKKVVAIETPRSPHEEEVAGLEVRVVRKGNDFGPVWISGLENGRAGDFDTDLFETVLGE